MANAASTGYRTGRLDEAAALSLDESRPGRVIVQWSAAPITLHVWVHERPLVAWWIGRGELCGEASFSELTH